MISTHDSFNSSFESTGSDEHIENSQLYSTNDDMTDEAPINEMNNSQSMNDTDPLANTGGDADIMNDENDRSIVRRQIVAVENLADNASGNSNANHSPGGNQNLINESNNQNTAVVHEPETESLHSMVVENRPTPDDFQNKVGSKDNENNGCVVKIEYVPLFNVHSSKIDKLLDEPMETLIVDDDVEMMIGACGIPLPMSAIENNVIKQEMDPISGNIPFTPTVG